MESELVRHAALWLVPLIAIMNPIAAFPALIAMTPTATSLERRQMAKRGCFTAGGVLLVFAMSGPLVFKFFGISLASFRIAGGLILLLLAIDNLQAKRSPVKETPEEREAAVEKDDVSVTPLAVPMLSGPGAISTVIVFQGQAVNFELKLVLYAVIGAATVVSYLAFRVFFTGYHKVNPIMINIVTRLMGLLLAATGVEFIVSGLKAAGVV